MHRELRTCPQGVANSTSRERPSEREVFLCAPRAPESREREQAGMSNADLRMANRGFTEPRPQGSGIMNGELRMANRGFTEPRPQGSGIMNGELRMANRGFTEMASRERPSERDVEPAPRRGCRFANGEPARLPAGEAGAGGCRIIGRELGTCPQGVANSTSRERPSERELFLCAPRAPAPGARLPACLRRHSVSRRNPAPPRGRAPRGRQTPTTWIAT